MGDIEGLHPRAKEKEARIFRVCIPGYLGTQYTVSRTCPGIHVLDSLAVCPARLAACVCQVVVEQLALWINSGNIHQEIGASSAVPRRVMGEVHPSDLVMINISVDIRSSEAS